MTDEPRPDEPLPDSIADESPEESLLDHTLVAEALSEDDEERELGTGIALAAEERDPLSQLLERLGAAPFDYDFHQAVRLIQATARSRPRIGASISVRDDPVRFGQEPSLSFAPASISKLDRGDRPRLSVRFTGLLGPNGPLPIHLTQYVRDRVIHHHDRTMSRFLDIFHHRVLSMFFRAWALNQPTVSRDRPEDDAFGKYLSSLIGLAGDPFSERDALSDDAKRHYAGWLSSQTRCAEGLASLLGDYFKVPVRIEEFFGHWIELPNNARLRLGETRATGMLGRTSIVGSRLWDVQQRFRVVLGPMGLADFERLLPTGQSFARMVSWVRNYAGFEFAWDAQLVLRAAEVPQTTLGGGSRLGWTTWMRTQDYPIDADQVVLRPPPDTAPV